MASILYVQRVRIESKPDKMHGWSVIISDAETGDPISDVYKAVITLDARELNIVELSYFKYDADGKKCVDVNDDKIAGKLIRNYPTLDAYAYAMVHSKECPHCHNQVFFDDTEAGQ